MSTKMIHDRAAHPYTAFGFSSVSEKAADERIARERQNPPVIVSKPRTYEELLAQIDELLAENAALKAAKAPVAKPRKSDDAKKSKRGRMKMPDVRTIRGAKHYSESYVAELLRVNQSTVGRRAVKHGVVADTSEGGKYYPASQLDNLKERKRQP